MLSLSCSVSSLVIHVWRDEMSVGKSLIIAVIVVINLDYHCCSKQTFLRMCYYRSYARHRNTIAKFELDHIDFSLCTHYIYAYGRIDNVTMLLEPDAPSIEEGSSGLFRRFLNGKKTNPTLKALMAIGGPEEKAHYGLVAIGQSDVKMDAFVKSVVNFVKVKGFDGLVVDWQPPDDFDTRAITVKLMERLRAQYIKVNASNLLLTLVIQDIKIQLDMQTTISKLMRNVDYIIIKAYDFPMNGMTYALFNSPLYPRLKSRPYDMYCVSFAVSYWKSVGINYRKMVVGMTGVGRILELANATQVDPASPITSKIEYGPYYYLKSGLAYPEVCVVQESSQVFFDDIQKNPYLVRGNTWVGFEDKRSIELKVKLFQQLDVAGIMFAGLDEDDFTGTMCKAGKYPLLSHIREILEPGKTQPSSTIQSPSGSGDKGSFDYNSLDDEATTNVIILVVIVILFILGYGIGHVIVVYRKGSTQPAPAEDAKDEKAPKPTRRKKPVKKLKFAKILHTVKPPTPDYEHEFESEVQEEEEFDV